MHYLVKAHALYFLSYLRHSLLHILKKIRYMLDFVKCLEDLPFKKSGYFTGYALSQGKRRQQRHHSLMLVQVWIPTCHAGEPRRDHAEATPDHMMMCK